MERLKNEGGGVVFIGDGMNDALALASADIGVAMPNASDLARSASIYNALLLPVAVLGLVAPVYAAIAMALSSVTVSVNSLRINFGR